MTKIFEFSTENSLFHACVFAAQMILSENLILMVKGEHIPGVSYTAETKDRRNL